MNIPNLAPEPILGLGTDRQALESKKPPVPRWRIVASRLAFSCGMIPVAAMTLLLTFVLKGLIANDLDGLWHFLQQRSVERVTDVVLVVCVCCMGGSFVLGIISWRTLLGRIGVASPFIVVALCFIVKALGTMNDLR